MEYKGFELTELQHAQGRWRVSIKKTDGTGIKVDPITMSELVTFEGAPSAERALQEARNLIDRGMIR